MTCSPTKKRQRVQDAIQPPEPWEFAEANRGTMQDRERAKQEFQSFALETWKELVQHDKRQSGNAIPCTALFCRIDIGVMVEGGNTSYFVNEVERSLTTSLWIDGMPEGLHGILADTFAFKLHDLLCGLHDPTHL